MLPADRPDREVGWPRAVQTGIAILGACAFGAVALSYGYGYGGGGGTDGGRYGQSLEVSDTTLPWFAEYWAYTDSANLASDPNGWYGGDNATGGYPVFVDTLTSTPWGGTGGLMLKFDSTNTCATAGEPSVGKTVSFPNASNSELWHRAWVRFDSDFRTDECGTSTAHKMWFFLSGSTTPGGTGGFSSHGRYEIINGRKASATDSLTLTGISEGVLLWADTTLDGASSNTAATTGVNVRTDLWDGAWHLIDIHIKGGSSTGAFTLYVDSVIWIDTINANLGAPSGDGFSGMAWGRNINDWTQSDFSWFMGPWQTYTEQPYHWPGG